MPRGIRATLALVVAAFAAGCDDPTIRPGAPYLLVEKGAYQSLYRLDGTIERLVYDRNGDRIADAVIFYGDDGRPHRGEIDTNLDAVVDRWEYFERGALVRVGYARRKAGIPDHWDVIARDGSVVGREYDDDADGAADRMEPATAGPRP